MGKAETRNEVQARIAKLSSQEREAKGQRILEILADLPEYQRSYTVMYYVALAGEVPTRGMILDALQQEKRVAVPKVFSASRRLAACQILNPERELRPGTYGILEPVKCAYVDVGQIDFVVVPGLAFDRSGRRLGRGAGYYDRFLSEPRFRAITCGVAFDVQIVERVPSGPRDVPVKMVVTESGLLKFERPQE